MSSLPFRVKAVYEYTSPHDDDLHFPNGQIITVTEDDEEDWYTGNYVDASGVTQEGIFPRNFVEKYEPTAPPRPTRIARPKKEEPAPEPVREPTPEPIEPEPVQEPEPEPEVERTPEVVAPPPVAREPPPPVPKQQTEASPPPAKSASKPLPSRSAGPPPVVEKPSGGSFRDRIAAFNKAAPPVAPFKPGGLGSGGSNTFIKKPFVAPPPSKNAYVPVPREAPPPKIYRREEDPEIAAKESENQELAERSGLAPTANEGDGEEQPKPTSLKERIALLQKQQMEQASRHADAAQKKEKPKRPVKKRVESHDTQETAEGSREVSTESGEPAGRASIDSAKDARPEPRRRKSSKAGLESVVDGNDADMSGAGETIEEPGDVSTGREDNDEKPRKQSMAPAPRAPAAPAREPDVGEEEGASEEEPPLKEDAEEEQDEDDIDPEVRRKEELRMRMAKMSGGMGMHGMFGPPAGMGMGMPPMAPPKKKKPAERRVDEEEEEHSPIARAPPVPMVPMPGITRIRSSEDDNMETAKEETSPISSVRPAEKVPDVEDIVPQPRAAPSVTMQESSAPPISGGRPAPPPVPKESRPSAPAPMSPSAGSESEYEEDSIPAQTVNAYDLRSEAPPPPPRPAEGPLSPLSPGGKRLSYFGSDQNSSPISPTTPGNKRLSRLPPPIPGAGPAASSLQPQTRAVPPPPPTDLSRSSTFDQQPHPAAPSHVKEDSEEEVTEYEGDYDTDIPPTAPHKDALKRDTNGEDSPPVKSPTSAPPPLPPTAAPRSLPPPLPTQPPPAPIVRKSVDMPRAAPPLPPQSTMPASREQHSEEYDPYNYSSNRPVPPPPQAAPYLPPRLEADEEDHYSASPPRAYAAPVQQQSSAPTTLGMMPSGRGPSRASTDIQRAPTTRRSVDLSRMSMDSGFVANDIDLAPKSFWWTQPKGMPPVLQGRRDVLFEVEEHASKSIITKEIYVLYLDYSQTIITAEFDAQNPADVKLEQRHEQPPARQRQDQLEQAHEQFGRRISEAVTSKRESVVGDGTPHGLIDVLLRPLSNALLPIGTRAYGAVVYSNLANASTQQNDEIRPGDIITLRNTKFQGKHGPMHAKYSMEVGKPDHVGVVAEWDGTKKKVRAWEQGRESRKVKVESYKLDDLRSGEVKIWRVMPRGWVGWSGK